MPLSGKGEPMVTSAGLILAAPKMLELIREIAGAYWVPIPIKGRATEIISELEGGDRVDL